MNNKEQAQKFLDVNKEAINTLVTELLEKITYNHDEKVHLLNEGEEVFTNKMLDNEIGKCFDEFIELPYRQKWIINNKIYFMLLPVEERITRLKDHKKKVNKKRIKKINKRRKTQKKK